MITLTETLIILDITKTESNNCFIHWTKKLGNHVSASSLKASSTNRETLTWLPLEIMHTWHDYPWPWVSLTWLLCNLQLWHHGRWFRKFTVRFRPIRKEWESSMYNKLSYQASKGTQLALGPCWPGQQFSHFEKSLPQIPSNICSVLLDFQSFTEKKNCFCVSFCSSYDIIFIN